MASQHAKAGDATPWVPARATIPKLREAVQECRGCDLWEHAIQGVMGDGPRRAPLMLVGEQPGDQEDQAGEPFVGPAGKLLDRALSEAGIEPDSVFRTNAVKHFRFSGTRGKQRIHKSPSRWHVAACQPWLLTELAVVKPQGVVLLGATAGASIFGPRFRIGERRGTPEPWPVDELPLRQPPEWVVSTMHPSGVLRSRNRDVDLAALIADLKVAAQKLSRPT